MILQIKPQELYYTGERKLIVKDLVTIRTGISTLIGKNGSGKSTFVQILEKGRNFRTNNISYSGDKYPLIKCIEFNDIHSLPGVSIQYYQQRYEESMNEDTPSVAKVIGNKIFKKNFIEYCNLLNLHNVTQKKINQLSSGELRKLLIANILTDQPDILILDNPFIGLDLKSKDILIETIYQLKSEGRAILLVLQEKEDAPSFTDNFIFAENQNIFSNQIVKSKKDLSYHSFNFNKEKIELKEDIIFQIKDCKIKYNNNVIIDNLNWTVKKGEKWSLTGPNGCGKSTLLSLINADNPKSYSNDITIFGHKRGSGESIWDIKKEIGYVSPEMQLHFHGSGTVLEIVANGLNDTTGLYIKPTVQQKLKALKWLEYFKISNLKDRFFSQLSSGERQMVLIARSLIKEPYLLILDEPMHALDSTNRFIVTKTIEDFTASHPQSSIIMVTHNPEFIPSIITNRLHLEPYSL